MLTRDYHAAARHSGMMCLYREWGGIQVVTIGGQQVYRARRQAKCRQCRNVGRRGTPCAPGAGGHPCNCGNPFTQALRPVRRWDGTAWAEHPSLKESVQAVG